MMYLVVLLFLLTTLSRSQGDLLRSGQNGIAISGEVAGANGTGAVGVAVGYSIESRFDIGLSVGRINGIHSETISYYPSTHATFVAPHVTYYVVHQDSLDHDITMGLTASYESIHYGTTNYRSPTEESISGGIAFTGDLLPSSWITFQPEGSITVISGSDVETQIAGGFFLGVKNAIGKVSGISAAVAYQNGMFSGQVSILAVF